MVRIAREDLEVKKKMLKFWQSAKGMERMVETMAQSLKSFGHQMGNSLMLLARSLANHHIEHFQAPLQQHKQQYVPPFSPSGAQQLPASFKEMVHSQDFGFEQSNMPDFD